MKAGDTELGRLFRAARLAGDAAAPSAIPFGFETRVVALWRRGGTLRTDARELVRWMRGLAAAAVLVTAVAGAAAYRELQDDDELGSPAMSAYAIADRAIESGGWQ